MAVATQRLEFRVEPELRSRIERAAVIVALPVSEFVRAAAAERADEVLSAHEETRVPPEFFDELIAALDAPYSPNEALLRAAARHRELVRQV
jgi:uncharacterized protein (DUF1778 family)